MKVRNWKTDEFTAFDGLMRQLHGVHRAARPDLFPPMEHPYSREEFEALVSNRNVLAIAAEENGEIIGLCIVRMQAKSGMRRVRTANMVDLVVDERFQHRGIARALYAEPERFARQKGAKKMELALWALNPGPIRPDESPGRRAQTYGYEKDR